LPKIEGIDSPAPPVDVALVVAVVVIVDKLVNNSWSGIKP
jgi:hypothetical protein